MFFGDHQPSKIRKKDLKRAKPENVTRLAHYLKLQVDGMSTRQVIKLIVWRLSPRRQWYR